MSLVNKPCEQIAMAVHIVNRVRKLVEFSTLLMMCAVVDIVLGGCFL